MMDIIGWLSSAMAVAGVVLNNFMCRWCFVLWMVSNGVSCFLHLRQTKREGGRAMWPLAARDLVFLILAIDGWYRWGGKP